MIVIGEKINATREKITRAIEARDAAYIADIVKLQDEAGADVIDVNAGKGKIVHTEEIEDMEWLIDVVESITKKPISIDSENYLTLEAGLRKTKNKGVWLNSISAERGSLDEILPMIKEFNCNTIALCMDETGIPKDVDGRLKNAEKIFEVAAKLGIKPDQLYFDPLVMPIATDENAGKTIIAAIGLIKKNFPGANAALGLSNVSFGLPQREILNGTFLSLCMSAGLDAAILDPTNEALMMVLRAADAILGEDPYCVKYIERFRKNKKIISNR